MGKGKKRKGKDLTLTKFFKRTFKPLWIDQKQLDAKTLTSYEETLAHWRHLTDNPALTDLDDMTMATFMSEMAKMPGKRKGTTMAANSLAKHARLIATIVKVAGPRNQSNPLGQNLIEQVPCIVIPKCRKEPPCSDWSIDEIRAMYDAAATMDSPTILDIPAPQWWRSAICVAYYTGLRINALMNIEHGMIEGSVIKVPGRLSKGGKGINQYLHKEALEHIAAIRRDGRDQIFYWPNWRTSKRVCYDTFDHLLDIAGIPPTRRKKKFHGFRATHCTTLMRVSSRHRLGERLAQQSAGHHSVNLTLSAYIGGDLQTELLAEAINAMPSPCGKAAALREAANNGENV